VLNDLDTSERPGPDENVVEVHVRTSFGDVAVHRSLASHREDAEA
jgi:hypothetical protein